MYSLVLNKRGGPNSREGEKFSENLINGGPKKRVCGGVKWEIPI